ncbi:uncharacterized protein LOC124287170 [Haliotis rubra]|uniref:uncharacterized protein LOC124287170 n=1 Tax=Haliotis rubra TaxID=36100 RepID=UPI001EE5BFAB|nr:uncharacterized protein LOC124287170 [Haliotis rubra]
MFSESNRKDLETKGYAVIQDVLTTEQADKYRGMYDDWLNGFEGAWPPTTKSLIQKFKVGHMEPTWAVRMKAKPVFAQIWGTEKLLTSFDGIAIGRPPEDGEEDFYIPSQDWLHVDQDSSRMGLHGYQGAVYLEHCAQDDWTFEVIEGSHHFFDRYYEECDYAVEQRKANPTWRVRNFRSDDVEWFKERCNCLRKRIPVPKGGMVVWDSRLIHANTRPLIRRKNPGRWRFVVFVCMAPAVWADEVSLQKKQRAYKEMLLTKHWPCNGISYFRERAPRLREMSIKIVSELPPSATTVEAQQLAGVLPYEPSDEDEEFLSRMPKWRPFAGAETSDSK